MQETNEYKYVAAHLNRPVIKKNLCDKHNTKNYLVLYSSIYIAIMNIPIITMVQMCHGLLLVKNPLESIPQFCSSP